MSRFRRMDGLLLCASLLIVSPAGRSEDWPAWRGPQGNGLSNAADLPVRWSRAEGIRWKAVVPGAGVSQPIVCKDRVFLTSSDQRLNDQLHVHCFDRRTGKKLWQTRLFGSAQPEGLFPPGGMAVPTPATDGQRIFALFGTGDLAALDWEGRPVWIRSLADEYGPFRNRWGMSASPILAAGLLIIQVDHWSESYLLAVDPSTGATRWRTIREAAVNWSTPLAVQTRSGTQIVACGTHWVRGYDARDGRELWKVVGLQMQCIPSPVAEGDLILAVSGRKGDTLAIRVADGRGDISKTHVVWKTTRGAPYVPSGLCQDGLYYLVDDEGIATCLDALTGRRLWQERMNGRFHASLVGGAGMVYYTDMDGAVTVVRAGRKFEKLARNEIGERIVASPALADGQVFLRGESHLFCLQR